jgi:hypothetical protein
MRENYLFNFKDEKIQRIIIWVIFFGMYCMIILKQFQKQFPLTSFPSLSIFFSINFPNNYLTPFPHPPTRMKKQINICLLMFMTFLLIQIRLNLRLT